MLTRLSHLAGRVHRFSPNRARQVTEAVIAGVLMDMGIAISVYQERLIEAAEHRSTAIDKLAMTFEAKAGALVGQVSRAAVGLQGTAQSMTGIAGEATHLATNVAATEEASVTVQTVAAAAAELASSITEISRQVAQSASVATKVRDDANRSDGAVQALADGAQELARSSA